MNRVNATLPGARWTRRTRGLVCRVVWAAFFVFLVSIASSQVGSQKRDDVASVERARVRSVRPASNPGCALPSTSAPHSEIDLEGELPQSPRHDHLGLQVGRTDTGFLERGRVRIEHVVEDASPTSSPLSSSCWSSWLPPWIDNAARVLL